MKQESSNHRAVSLAVARLNELLAQLGEQEITKAQVAARAGVPSQYLSDVRCQRRPLTELFARRLAEEFNCDYQWLLGAENSLQRRDVSATPSLGGNVLLPLFSHPVEGNPRTNPKWPGTYVEVSSIAAAKVAKAVYPYVLRFGHDDKQRRLRKGDLILISQSPSGTAELIVVRFRKKSFLARNRNKRWFRAATGEELRGDCAVIGHCVGIIWSALS